MDKLILYLLEKDPNAPWGLIGCAAMSMGFLLIAVALAIYLILVIRNDH